MMAQAVSAQVVREGPILMSGPMVRATLADRKGQTRRVMNPQPFLTERAGLSWKGGVFGWDPETRQPYTKQLARLSPYGVPGDRLWVRETWAKPVGRPYVYRADENAAPMRGWRPSIFMPRAASRLLLDVTKVRVERVQAITEEDAVAEGSCIRHAFGDTHACYLHRTHAGRLDARCCFSRAWEELNAKPRAVLVKKRVVGYVSYPWAEVPDPERTHRGKPWHVRPDLENALGMGGRRSVTLNIVRLAEAGVVDYVCVGLGRRGRSAYIRPSRGDGPLTAEDYAAVKEAALKHQQRRNGIA